MRREREWAGLGRSCRPHPHPQPDRAWAGQGEEKGERKQYGKERGRICKGRTRTTQLSSTRGRSCSTHILSPVSPIHTDLFSSEENLDFFFDTSVYKVQHRKQTRFPLSCFPIKCLQPSKYRNSQSPCVSPEASKACVDFYSKSVTGASVQQPLAAFPKSARPRGRNAD